jgi:nucleotide-binding universal stress UspA family protein
MVMLSMASAIMLAMPTWSSWAGTNGKARTSPTSDDAKHLSAHLANHGIKIEPGVIQTRSEEEPIALRQQMEKADYDLLVMGGYSHPKWLEFIFGGATQAILLSSKIPVLVSH